MIDIDMLRARGELFQRAVTSPELVAYIRDNGIDLTVVTGMAGITAIADVLDIGAGRFGWQGAGSPVRAFLCECLDEDGETTLDLAAWPLDRPEKIMTMFGRAPLLGMWAACNPATFIFDKPLAVHRTALGWLQSGCRGSAIATPALAARLFLDLPGALLVADHEHRREIETLMRGLFDRQRIIVADKKAAAA